MSCEMRLQYFSGPYVQKMNSFIRIFLLASCVAISTADRTSDLTCIAPCSSSFNEKYTQTAGTRNLVILDQTSTGLNIDKKRVTAFCNNYPAFMTCIDKCNSTTVKDLIGPIVGNAPVCSKGFSENVACMNQVLQDNNQACMLQCTAEVAKVTTTKPTLAQIEVNCAMMNCYDICYGPKVEVKCGETVKRSFSMYLGNYTMATVTQMRESNQALKDTNASGYEELPAENPKNCQTLFATAKKAAAEENEKGSGGVTLSASIFVAVFALLGYIIA